eukprot:391193-Rhodomonas_salina.2
MGHDELGRGHNGEPGSRSLGRPSLGAEETEGVGGFREELRLHESGNFGRGRSVIRLARPITAAETECQGVTP